MKSRNVVRLLISVAFLSIADLTLLSLASAQDFTLMASPASPAAVFAGGQTATSTINVSALNSANSVDVTFSPCVVTPQQTTGTPTCVLSPATVTTPANASLTITTASTTPDTLYSATITGTITGTSTTHSVTVNLTVLSAIPEYTLTITTALNPTSVHAGSGATSVLTLTPINGYTGTVSLSCSTIIPSATPAPTCAFNPASVAITTGTAQTSTLTISTTGATATAISHSRVFYGLWLPIPGLALIALGFGKAEKRRSRLLGLWFLCAIAAGLMLLPACNTSSTGTSTATPKNTYSFTISATDAHALAPSNGIPTVSLTVN